MSPLSIRKLVSWFLDQKRSLPWRDVPHPYAVWVSEVMLQQTQVAVVVPYFERWMKRFPTIQALAEAPVDAVLKEWEGLGYYSRARHLHAGAQYVVHVHGGELPSTREALMKIKGLGEYTVGAILSFAFKKRAAAVDGNVLRVLARFENIEEPIDKPQTRQLITKRVEDFLPEKEPWIVSEALIELGATICGKKPKCVQCPLNTECKGYLKGVAEELPKRSPRRETIVLYRGVVVVECEGNLLVRKAEKGKIMADLYEFPYFDLIRDSFSQKECRERVVCEWGVEIEVIRRLENVQHTFTHHKAHLNPFHVESLQRFQLPGHRWVSFEEISQLPFSSGHRRVLTEIISGRVFCLPREV